MSLRKYLDSCINQNVLLMEIYNQLKCITKSQLQDIYFTTTTNKNFKNNMQLNGVFSSSSITVINGS